MNNYPLDFPPPRTHVEDDDPRLRAHVLGRSGGRRPHLIVSPCLVCPDGVTYLTLWSEGVTGHRDAQNVGLRTPPAVFYDPARYRETREGWLLPWRGWDARYEPAEMRERLAQRG